MFVTFLENLNCKMGMFKDFGPVVRSKLFKVACGPNIQ
jgi:hypothetical protein